MNTKRKMAGVLLAAVCMAAAWTAPCRASEVSQPDMDQYEEQLRELLEQKTGGEETSSPEVDLSQIVKGMEKIEQPDLEMGYHQETRMFEYSLPSGAGFFSSVPNRMITCDPVTFLPIDDSRVTVTRNGGREDEAEDGYYSQVGKYHVSMLKYPVDMTGSDRHTYQVDFYFQIIPSTVSALNLLQAPDEFYIEKLELDGRSVETEGTEWEFLQKDGHYKIWFLDQATGTIRLPLSFIRDTRAPLLIFTPAIDRAEMTKTVTYEIDDPEAVLEIYYEGQQVKLPSNQIDVGGYYQFHVADQAGNERFYKVKMAQRFHMPGKQGIIMIVIVIAGAAGFLFYQRRNVRVL